MAQTAQINIKVDERGAQNSVNNLNTSLQQTEKTTTSLRAQLRQVTQELQGLEPGSARFNELSQRAGQLRDTIQDTSAVIKATAGNLTENLAKGLTNVASIGVNAFQGIMGAATLFGIESENLQKTMVTLQAAMALTSSLEFFGGLEDKVTEIKASFQGLGQALGFIKTQQVAAAASATALAVGETAAGAAAGAAVVPVTALSTAMKSIPFVAIAAGLAAIAYGVYDYMQASKEATKEDKKRKDVLAKLKEEEKEQATYLAKETQEFTSLIYQLKATNAGSKERSSLITQINGKYGTILKNMGSEIAFQNQLNTAVAQYIALSYNKYKITKNEEEIGKLNAQRFTQEKKQAELREQFEKQRSKAGEASGAGTYYKETQTFEQFLDKNSEFSAAWTKTTQTIRATNDGLSSLGGNILQTQSEIDKMTKTLMPNTDAVNTNTGAINVNTDANDKNAAAVEQKRNLLDRINGELEREKSAIQQLTVLEIDREKIGDGIYEKRNKIQQDLVKADLDYDTFKNSLVEKATQRELDALEEIFVNGTMSEKQYRAELIKINMNGINNLLDIELELLAKKELLRQEDRAKIKADLEERTSDNLASADLLYYQLGQSKVQFDKQMALKEIDASNKTEEEKKKLRLETLKYYEQVEIEQVNNISQKELDILYEKYQDDLKLAEENGEDKTKIDAQYEKDRVELEQTAQIKIMDIQSATNQNTKDKFSETLTDMADQLGLWGGKVMEMADAINALFAQQTQNQIDAVNSRYKTESDNLQTLYDQKALTEEEFNAQKKALDQQREQEEIALKRKQFNRDKAFNISNAIMTGAQAVLNGLATQPLVPVGIIMAAMAGALTGIQVATISKQQFKAARGGIVPGSGDGSIDSVPSLLAPGEAVINANSAAMFPNTLSLINQAGGGISLAPALASQGSSGSGTIFTDNRSNQPVRAYVVETEITNSQKRVNRIERSVEF